MRSCLVVVAVGAMAGGARAQSAQPIYGNTEIDRAGELVDAELTYKCDYAGCPGGGYVGQYFYRVRKGERLHAYIDGAIQGAVHVWAFPKHRTCDGTLDGTAKTCGWNEPAAEDGELYITVQSPTPAKFRIGVYDGTPEGLVQLLTPKASRRPIWGITTIARDQPVNGSATFERRGKYIVEYFYPAKAGEKVSVYIDGGVTGSMSLHAGLDRQTLVVPLDGRAGHVGWPTPLTADEEVYIRIDADQAAIPFRLVLWDGDVNRLPQIVGGVGGVETPYAPPPALPAKSQVRGLTFGAGFAMSQSSIEMVGDSESTNGVALRFGYGFNDSLELFLSYESESNERVARTSWDLGFRWYLLGASSILRPYAQGSIGTLDRTHEMSSMTFGGTSLGAGGGLAVFWKPWLSTDIGLVWSSDSYSDAGDYSGSTFGVRIGAGVRIGGAY